MCDNLPNAKYLISLFTQVVFYFKTEGSNVKKSHDCQTVNPVGDAK